MRGRFEILVGKTSIGADISWLSQFFGEEEFCYKPLTHLQVGEKRLEEHNGKQLSILQMKLTVNQRSKTVKQAEVARKDFLTQLASSLEWDVRHWAKRQELLERLAPEIADMRAALQAVVAAEVEASKLNDNEHFGTVFGRVIEVSEEKRQELAESVWQDGEAARGRGEADAAAALFEKAIDARGRGLCADDKQGRDRIVAMPRVLMEAKGGGRTRRRRRGPRGRWQMI